MPLRYKLAQLCSTYIRDQISYLLQLVHVAIALFFFIFTAYANNNALDIHFCFNNAQILI